ncbi:MAG: phosphoglucosamine mutase, partial [Planctomycetota bacterium]
KMLETGARLGGEQSGHLILLKESTTGDGILAALALTEVMLRTNKRLSELAKVMRRFPQVLINVPVSSKPPLQNLPPVQEAVREAERLLGSTGRLLLRYSGTEPGARVMAEGDSRKKVKEAAELVADAIKRSIGSE